VAEEVVVRRVLVQPTHEIRDGAVEVLGPHHGRIQEQPAHLCLHRARLVIGHALQHLELDEGLDAILSAQDEAVGDVEQVVRGDAEMDDPRVLGLAAVLDHALEVGVHLHLRGVGGLRPAVHGRLDPLHGEVRALDDAELDGRAAPAASLGRPGHERALDAVRLGQIGLEHDARGKRSELLLVEHLAERGDRRIEVPVLLHVEVDELRVEAPVGISVEVPLGLSIEHAQGRLHAVHGVTERHQVDLAEDGGHLHRDVLDVVAGQERQVSLQAAGGFALAQDGLAEEIQVEPDAVTPPLGQVAAQILLLAGEDQRLGLVPEARHDGRHDQARKVVGHHAAQHQRDLLPPLHEPRPAIAFQQEGELVGDAGGAPAAEGLIDERDGELLAVRIRHQPGEPAGLGQLLGRLLRAGFPQQRLRQLDGAGAALPPGEHGE